MVGWVERAEGRAGTDCRQPRVDLAQGYVTVWGQGLLSFPSGWVGRQLLCMEELVAV